MKLNNLFQRFALGLLVGLLASIALLGLLLVAARTNIQALLSLADLGGIIRILLAGGLTGLAYAMLFRPNHGDHANDFMRGIVVGIACWIVFLISLFPLLQGALPSWDAEFTSGLVPGLISNVVQGGFSGLLYGIFYHLIGLNETVTALTPEQQQNVVIVGVGQGFGRKSPIQGTIPNTSHILGIICYCKCFDRTVLLS